jgi:type II secretory pathway component PulM
LSAGIVLLVLLGPWVLVWRISSRRKRERDEDNERWQELSSRTYALEQTVRALQAQRPGSAAEEATPKTFLTSVSQTQISNLE